MMTEKDAREKWCPHARPNNDDYSPNRKHTNDQESGSQCIASVCMAWRWVNMAGYSANAARKGFCGIAGKPE